MQIAKIPPKNEWNDLSTTQLYEVKSKMMDVYYNMRMSNASFANQYKMFIDELSTLIEKKTSS